MKGLDTNYDHLMDKALATTVDQRNELYAANKSLRAQNATLLEALNTVRSGLMYSSPCTSTCGVIDLHRLLGPVEAAIKEAEA